MSLYTITSRGLNRIYNDYKSAKSAVTKKNASKILANIRRVSQTTRSFIRKNPKTIIVSIGFASLFAGICIGGGIPLGAGLVLSGIASLVTATSLESKSKACSAESCAKVPVHFTESTKMG